MALLQENRLLQLSTPLPDDELVLTAFEGVEQVSGLFRFTLEMLSERNSITPKELVGSNVTFGIKRGIQEVRYFNGFVMSLTAGNEHDGRREYRAEVVPWLWFLGRTSDCRVFQDMTTLEIVEKVFRELNFGDFRQELRGDSRKRDYCVQFRETDLAFVSRLLEEDGIFYRFEHEYGKHVLVMSDAVDISSYCDEAEVNFPDSVGAVTTTDHLTAWEHAYEFRSGKLTIDDYNFEAPRIELEANCNSSVVLPGSESLELYDFPGLYEMTADGRNLVKIRMEAEEIDCDVIRGASSCRTFTAGRRFKVNDHRSSTEQGTTWFLTAVQHEAREGMGYQSGVAEAFEYGNRFQAIPDSISYRPVRQTPKPVVQGIQTAVVVGPANEEIHCDKFGRVKVQFHWDREGRFTERSSCWIRVAQLMAGRNWGFLALPRIGQEVVVDFLDGDPDRPIIIGSVYNADQMPAYKLPEEQTKSYFKSCSSKGASGFNEIRFEDKKGAEQLFLHAQKNLDVRVENTVRETIRGDRHSTVEGNARELVKADLHSETKGKSFGKVGGDLSLTVGQSRHTKVGQLDACEAGQEIHLKAGMKVVIEAGTQISLVGPGGFVDIGPAGVTIQGTMVKINSGGAKASGSGAKPTNPETPEEADDQARSGHVSG